MKKEFEEFMAKSPLGKSVKEEDTMYTLLYGFFLGGYIQGLTEYKEGIEKINQKLKDIVEKK